MKALPYVITLVLAGGWYINLLNKQVVFHQPKAKQEVPLASNPTIPMASPHNLS